MAKNTTRRDFLKAAGLGATAMAVSSLPIAKALAAGGGGHGAEMVENPKALKGRRWAMAVFTDKLTDHHDFEPLIHACHTVHNVPHIEGQEEIKWIWADHFHAVFPTFGLRWPEQREPDKLHKEFLLLCNHCSYPPCVRVCPTKATFQRPDGIVIMDYHRCIGCRYCMAGCPYGARSFNFQDPRPHLPEEINREFPTRTPGVVEKCNFCAERLAEGKMPACVEASKGALVFGDLNDPRSEISKVLKDNFVIRRKPEIGTQPNVYYVI
jgi:molybdopterin-containing oxidoreductase family iron-sulfur binding subunit